MTVLRQAKGLRKLDLSQPKRRDEYILMFIHIDSELRRKGFLLPIKVCPVEGCNRKAVETSARRLCFSMASISKATHLIYPDPPGTTTEDVSLVSPDDPPTKLLLRTENHHQILPTGFTDGRFFGL